MSDPLIEISKKHWQFVETNYCGPCGSATLILVERFGPAKIVMKTGERCDDCA